MMPSQSLGRDAISRTLIKPAAGSTVRIRPIALPVEHGGWSLLFEPLVLGLLLAPSTVGVFVSIAALNAFLARHPFKLAMITWRSGRKSARLPLSVGFALLYAAMAAIFLGLALTSATENFVLPIILAAPLALVQLFYDGPGRSRELLPELLGSIAVASTSAAIVLAGGWTQFAAFGLWAVVVSRVAPTIMYVRARLRQRRCENTPVHSIILMHVLAVVLISAPASFSVVPGAVVLALLLLLARAVIGFSRQNRDVKAKHLGLLELAFGAITVFVAVIGYTLA